MKHIVVIVGTRPNFIKAVPVYDALVKLNKFKVTLLHTGQHYDKNMSDIFLEQLDVQDKTTYLDADISNKSQNSQIALIMLSFEKFLLENKTDLIVVFGDVTSTLACALTSNKLNIKLAHVESGNRSFDKSMPEEINRLLVDNISDYLFIAEPNGISNLKLENIDDDIFDSKNNKSYYVGNSMIDTLLKLKDYAAGLEEYKNLKLQSKNYILVTLHRPHNVDNVDNLKIIFDALLKLSKYFKIVFPVHPRKKQQIIELIGDTENIILTEPLGYLQFLNLNIHSGVVVTDSGGLQEECTVLKIPCVTLRPNTERPITCTHGTNMLIKTLNADVIYNTIFDIMTNTPDYSQLKDIYFWDGDAGYRIAKILSNLEF